LTVGRKLRMTNQRRVILEELKKVTSHPTADEVYQMVRQRLPHISLGTVYRNLEVLSQCGMIQRLALGINQRHFDANIENHYHIRCINCGRLEDVPIEPVAAFDNVLRGMSDYEIIGHRLEFIGLCPQCKK